jgi:hypothetical protein
MEVTYDAVDRFTPFGRRPFPQLSVFTYAAVSGSQERQESGIGKD